MNMNNIRVHISDYQHPNCSWSFTKRPVINVICWFDFNEITKRLCARIVIPSTYREKHILLFCVSAAKRTTEGGHILTVKWSEEQWNMSGMENQAFKVTLFFISCVDKLVWMIHKSLHINVRASLNI